MNSICPEINTAIRFALNTGNEIKEKSEGWTKAKQVFFMKNKLTQELKNKIQKEISKLEYWQDAGSPHNEPAEGFFCNNCMVGISFPVPRKIVR